MRRSRTTSTDDPVIARRLLRALLLVAGAALLAYSGALLWWDLWMGRAWPGPPALLHALWPTGLDGEASYDVTGLEMFVVLFAVFVPVMFGLTRLRRRR